MARNIIDLPTLGDDGRLYRDTALDLVESLIPNPWKSCHAPDLLELENGDLLCCWFAGSREGNDVNNRRYEYPVMMQSKDGKIHAAYAWGRRVRIKYVCVDEAWIRGAKVCKGAEDNPEMPCNR